MLECYRESLKFGNHEYRVTVLHLDGIGPRKYDN